MIAMNMNKSEQWMEAIAQWEKALGSEAVLIKKTDVLPYTKNTIGASRNIKGVLLPRTSQEVQTIVCIANKYKTPLYPISGGKNWGYGSCNPVENTSFIVDLSKMKRISEYDPELGVVTVEPGVTQQDLHEFFKKNGNLFMVPTTGAGPSASILGNALERGYGLTPYSDHFEAVTSFQAVLPNGDIYIPALEELGAKKINQIFKWGLGPYLDGLFTQGNFGIVTKSTILLARRPEFIATFFFSLKSDECLENAIKAIREIKQDLGSNVGAINLMNMRRVLSMIEPFPKNETNGQNYIGDKIIIKLAIKHQLTEWTGFGSIYGKNEISQASQKIIKKILKPYITRIHFVSEKKIKKSRLLRFVIPKYYQNNLKPKLDLLESAIQNVSGFPSQVALPLAYMRNSKSAEMTKILNPAHDNCGLIWHSPLVPLTPLDIRKHVTLVNSICPKHDINPLITLTIFSSLCCDSTIPILFDRENEIEEAKAKNCHNELLESEGAVGYYPYRLGIDTMNKVIDPNSICWKFSQQLKLAIDPNQLIAPGRYTPYCNTSKNMSLPSNISLKI